MTRLLAKEKSTELAISFVGLRAPKLSDTISTVFGIGSLSSIFKLVFKIDAPYFFLPVETTSEQEGPANPRLHTHLPLFADIP